ncbi:MAG: 8-amino-7-oxononanoate synthase, partial [Planctomycetaceae bacterium]
MTPEPDWLTDALRSLEADDLVRPHREVELLPSGRCRADGEILLDFSSNDYLGLARDLRLDGTAAGAGASPLVSGRSPDYCRLEKRLAAFENADAALLFPTGFAANTGTVAALVGPGDAIFSHSDNHASLIDGCRLSGARVHIFDGQRLDQLEMKLEEASSAPRRLIVTDGVFSMDGVLAPLGPLCDLADNFSSMLLVDEAHGTGVHGANGRGSCEAAGVEDRVTLRVGTLSKAVGSTGGFVVGNSRFIEYLWHKARTQVFSTALSPASCAAALAGLEVIVSEPQRRQHLAGLSDRLWEHLRRINLPTPSNTGAILPVILGDSSQAIAAASRLRDRGFFVPAIRPPTVRKGTARLRISLSASHSTDDIDHLAD